MWNVLVCNNFGFLHGGAGHVRRVGAPRSGASGVEQWKH